jgi:uncharacterized protein DUF4349
MSRHEQRTLSAQMRRELEAVDAALTGEPLRGDDAPLGELTLTLRSLRPRPGGDFIRALDARAARGFAPDMAGEAAARDAPAGEAPASQAPARERLRPRRRRPGAVLLMPAAGLGLAVVVAVLAVSLSGGSGGRQAGQAVSAGPSRGLSAPPAPVAAPTVTRGTPFPGAGKADLQTTAGSASAPSVAAPTARQVERTSTLEVGVAPGSIQSAAQRVFALTSAFGGYVRQSSVSAGSVGQGGASFDVRLPSANLSAAIAALSRLGHVRSETDTTNDVTDQVSSLERSLGGLQAERASLLRQLAAASEAQLEASLRARLRAVEGRISQLQGQLGALRSRIAYTGLALSLTPEAAAGAASGDLTPGGAAHDAARILDAALAVLVIAAAAVLPLGSLIVGAWFLTALMRRRLREQALDAS